MRDPISLLSRLIGACSNLLDVARLGLAQRQPCGDGGITGMRASLQARRPARPRLPPSAPAPKPMDLLSLFSLFLVAVVAGCFDAIAGGGGLLTVPALLLAGLDPVSAVATNKLQGSAGTVSATLAFARRGLIDWRRGWPIAVIAAIASVAGALCASLLSKECWRPSCRSSWWRGALFRLRPEDERRGRAGAHVPVCLPRLRHSGGGLL